MRLRSAFGKGWLCGRECISKGGRVILIKSMLLSLPLYLMSILHLPRKARLSMARKGPCGMKLLVSSMARKRGVGPLVK